ncbi:hypothetical protein [Mycobacterium sp. NPDC006124]|uniref:hypothetical protein n=1 Tax=Mycobacterium sp. NPDC006124 TaxID=3156729 RepID=UPI0033A5C766
MSRRVIVFAVVGLSVAAVIVVVSGSMTYWFGLTRPVTNAAAAQSICEDAVKHDLLAPSNVSFRDVDTKQDRMSEGDNVGLGADAKRVKEVWAVGGEVESPGASGSSSTAHFLCRTYSFDGQPTRGTVHFPDTDYAGQLLVKP